MLGTVENTAYVTQIAVDKKQIFLSNSAGFKLFPIAVLIFQYIC